jgi:hypothetical protein
MHWAYKHGHSTKANRASPEFRCWSSMRQRCLNPDNPGFANYGGRGITIDPAWDDFRVFLRDMGLRPSPEHSINRLDNDGPYASWNCEWSTRDQQNFNKRNSRTFAIDEVDFPMRLLAGHLCLQYKTLQARIYGVKDMKPWSMERIIYNNTMWGM